MIIVSQTFVVVKDVAAGLMVAIVKAMMNVRQTIAVVIDVEAGLKVFGARKTNGVVQVIVTKKNVQNIGQRSYIKEPMMVDLGQPIQRKLKMQDGRKVITKH